MANIASFDASMGAAPGVKASDSARGAIFIGLAIIALFFGAFGTWAALAPLDGAIVGEGVVTVDGNRKSVDHLEGGIVKSIAVREGDHVAAGDILITLDDERLRAQAEIFSQQVAVARATEARLTAELAGSESIDFPADLTTSELDYVQRAIASQAQEFATRRTALDGAEQVLLHRIEDLARQNEGRALRRDALQTQLTSIRAELVTLNGLLADGLTTKGRILELERAAASLEADISETLASIASNDENIAETRQQIEQLGNDRRAEIASQLNEVQSRVLDLGPSLANAEASLARTVVRAPYDGKVVGLKVFSTGAVVPAGGTILDIVPDATGLVVDARVRVEDITDLKLGADAEVHFTSYRRFYVPTMRAKVATVSADRLTDERTGVAYYLAQVVVDPEDLAENPDVSLYPGMPAQVMIITERRSALQYLLGPLFASFDGAFRQN